MTEQCGWYYAGDGEAIGPYSIEELKEKLVSLKGPDTLVHRSGMEDWQRAGDLPELATVPTGSVASPPAILWLVYLFFRPRVFFKVT